MNCWEFMLCGREENGARALERGVCPAFTQGAGQACWFIAGTFCGGKVQGEFAAKLKTCIDCDFFKSLSFEHKAAMWRRFGPPLN